jgi:MFS family permease
MAFTSSTPAGTDLAGGSGSALEPDGGTEPAAATEPAAGERDPKRWWILALLGIAQLMVVLDATIVNIALPHAQASLRFSNADRQWIVTAYSLAFGSLLLLGGRLADLFGRKRLFLTGVIGFALASAVGGASVNFAMLATARAVQGGFGALLAPMYVNVVFAVIATIGAAVLLALLGAEIRQRIDRAGTVLAAAGMFAIVYGFAHAATKSGGAGWTDPQTIAFLAASVVLLGAFVVVERRVAQPLLPLRVVSDRNRGGAYAAMFLASIGMFGVFLFITYYLETVLRYSPVKTGLAFLPLTGAVMVSAALGNTVLISRFSPRLLIPLGLVAGSGGMALMTRIGLHSAYTTSILPPLLLVAVGLGLVFAPCFSLGTLGVAGADAGIASATVNVSQQIGGSIGTALLNTIATTAAASYVAAHTIGRPSPIVLAEGAVHSYIIAFWVGAAIFFGAALIVAPLLRPGIADLGANERLESVPVH